MKAAAPWLAAGAGAALVGAFAPFNQAWLAPLVFACLMVGPLATVVATARSAGGAALLGACFGLVFFLAGSYWVYVSMHRFGQIAPPVAGLLTLLFAAYLALFPALVFALAGRGRSPWRLALTLAGGWVLAEWLRGHLFTGFPWLLVGYSQLDGPLGGYAPVIGVYGVSLLVLIAGALLALVVRQLRQANWPLVISGVAGLLLLYGGGELLRGQVWSQPVGAPLRVALVQGDEAQSLRWSAQRLSHILATYLDLTATVDSADLILWPENAVPQFADRLSPTWFDQVQALLLKRGRHGQPAVLLTGMPVRSADGSRYFNGLVDIARAAAPEGQYRKRHLVPFGEYVPLRAMLGSVFDLLRVPMSGFSDGPAQQPLLRVAGHPLAAAICYEMVYPELLRTSLPAGTVIVNVSNDSWFGNTIAPHQHLQMARFRAWEAQRPLLRATNTGLTALVDYRGQVLARVPPFSPRVLRGDVQPRSGATPYVRLGDAPALALAVLLVVIGLAGQRMRHRDGS